MKDEMKELMSNKSFWICLLVFGVIYLALRVFWLAGDPGIAAVWEYGYNATDEGYYLSGGKEKLLWKCFVDLARTETFTYGYSAGTHFLSYLAHLAFGLSTWTWRLPFFIINCLAWLAMFVYLSRRSGAVNSLLLCLTISTMPMIIAYERTASNDALIGSLAILAYVIAAGKSRWRIFAAAALTGLIVLVKPSIWVLLPMVAAGVLQTAKFRKRWIDVAVFVAVVLACVGVCKLLVMAAILPEARASGVSIGEIIRRTTGHYALPGIFDFASHFKGLSAFPRDPSYVLLGVSTAFVFVLPIAMAMKNIVNLRFNGNTLLLVFVPAYVAAINVMNTQYTHYFIPALMFLPLVINAAASEMAVTDVDGAVDYRRLLPILGVVVIAGVIGILFLSDYKLSPQLAQQYYSRIYNFPAKNVWGATASLMAIFVVAMVAVLTVLRGIAHARHHVVAWLVAAFLAASVVFAAIPAIQIAPYMHQQANWYFVPMAVTLVVTVLLLIAIFGIKGELWRGHTLTMLVVAAFAVCYLLTPNWRQAAADLLRAPTHYHRDAAQELAKLLPTDAIVLGERAPQMLMSLPIRTVSTCTANSDPIPIIKSLRASNPKAKLYALVDTQHAYNLQHYREHAKEYSLRPIKTFRMPSFATGKLADVYLCQIVALP